MHGCKGEALRRPGCSGAALRNGAPFFVPPAGNEVIVHHARRLTKCINDGWPTEIETADLQILSNTLRERRLGWDFGYIAKFVLHASAVEKAPKIGRKAFGVL